jgi:hypothetical protein
MFTDVIDSSKKLFNDKRHNVEDISTICFKSETEGKLTLRDFPGEED